MLIYVKIYPIWSLRYFTCGCLCAHSTQPVSISAIQSELSILEQNIKI